MIDSQPEKLLKVLDKIALRLKVELYKISPRVQMPFWPLCATLCGIGSADNVECSSKIVAMGRYDLFP